MTAPVSEAGGVLKILDLTAGKRAVWFNKNHPLATYVDIRPEVSPGVVADSANLPVSVGDGYSLIIFDPPHVNFGKNANLSKDYGHHTTAEIRDIVRMVAREAHRVSSENAVMSFKWNTHDQKLKPILDLMLPYWEPLVGHGVSNQQARRSETFWCLLLRANIAKSAALKSRKATT